MKVSFTEIATIIVVISMVVVITQLIGIGRRRVQKKPEDKSPVQSSSDTPKKRNWWVYIRRSGIVFVIVGIILLAIVLSTLKWVFQNYIAAIILIVLGLVFLIMSRKK